MARTVTAGSSSTAVAEWCTTSLCTGAKAMIGLRMDSSAPHCARVTMAGAGITTPAVW